jgi:hypothetical protein
MTLRQFIQHSWLTQHPTDGHILALEAATVLALQETGTTGDHQEIDSQTAEMTDDLATVSAMKEALTDTPSIREVNGEQRVKVEALRGWKKQQSIEAFIREIRLT